MVEAPSTRLQRSMFLLAGLAVLVLVAGVTLLNIRLGRTARQVVKEQFNQAQLVVARSITYWIEKQVGLLERELRLSAAKIGSAVMAPPLLFEALQPSLERVTEQGVTAIEVHERHQPYKYVFYAQRQITQVSAKSAAYEDARHWIRQASGTVSTSEPSGDGSDMHFTISLALEHAVFDTVAFQINLSWFLTPFLQSIRSGKTGYAWIIDSQGRFLFHPQPGFIGRSAFDARRKRDPDISHHQIDTIQRDSMLQGLEGAGTYHSGWHRGITGRIEKLIAYSPVTISDTPPQRWSVAVVAPVFEIEDPVRGIYSWQVLLQSVTVLLIVAAGGVIGLFQLRSANRLKTTIRSQSVALKHAEDKYHTLVESAEDFIFTLDQAGRLLSVNSFTANWFGNRSRELIGRGLEHLFPQEAAGRHFEIIRQVFQKGKSIRDEFELRGGHAETWLSANFMPLKNEAGFMTAVLCIARDITEHKKLERRLVNTEKLASLGTLAAGVAHEINNPLGVILGFCDLLARTKEPGSQEYEDLKIVERQGLHCKQVVENLLCFAHAGRELSTEADLNHCLQDIIKVVRHSLKMKAIDLQLDLTENLPSVAGDYRQLQQVFLNLINNAAAAMPEGGVLSIATEYAGTARKAVVRVRDQGQGIAPEIMDHIFEPFFTTRPEGEGTGLGLFISYGIINKFGGSIVCESQPDVAGDGWAGTTFTVMLPVAV